jgi:hypothetical protein
MREKKRISLHLTLLTTFDVRGLRTKKKQVGFRELFANSSLKPALYGIERSEIFEE